MASSDQVKRHPQLAAIVGDLVAGAPLQQVASLFGLEEEAVQDYAQEAGLASDRFDNLTILSEAPPSSDPDQDQDHGTLDQAALEGDEQAERAEQPRKDPESYLEDRHGALQQLRDAVEAERGAYERQPRPFLTLCSDPEFRIGWQPAWRLSALIDRERAEKARQLAVWKACPWNWRQPVPPELR